MGQNGKIGLYYHTLKFLRLEQIVNRIKRKIFRPLVDSSAAPSVSCFENKIFHFNSRPRTIEGSDTFNFLNRKEVRCFPKGWNDNSLPKLWLYNLHYFEGLMNSDTSVSLKLRMIDQWIDHNPPAFGNGWEPYPISLRIVNWIKWALLSNNLSQKGTESLAVQTRFLKETIEYHLLGNHIFANAKALIFAGLFFEGEEADDWFKMGVDILSKQVSEQFLDDGAHFELSTTYHALLTEDLLDIIQFFKVMNKDVPCLWEKIARKAVDWLVTMTRPDGYPPLFNDAAYGITPSLRDILLLSKAGGLEEPSNLKPGMTDLIESGYFRYEADTYSFFGDAGQIGPDYIPGHAHCDMLNFELFAHGKPIIVDTGTSTYENCERRHIERGTASHNTVQFDDMEQSEIWGAFRVARRARIVSREVNSSSVLAKYVGYNSPKIFHERKFLFNENGVTISDMVNQNNDAVARFHFHPDIFVEEGNGFIKAGPIELIFSGHTDIRIVSYKYAPEFNKLVKAQVLEVPFSEYLKTEINI